MEMLTRFIGSALGSGESGVVIATEKHRAALGRRMTDLGVDLRRIVEQCRYLALDGAATLSQFMVDDWPDETRFAELLGDVIARAQSAAQNGCGRVSLLRR